MSNNWSKIAVASGVAAATACLFYYIFKGDDEEGDEFESYKHGYDSSTNKVDQMSRSAVLDLLNKISASQDATKNLMLSLIDDLLNDKCKDTLLDVYERALPLIPADPLETLGMTIFDLDHIVERYQHDPLVRESIIKIMNIPDSQDDNVNISVEEILDVHEFMFTQLEALVKTYKNLPNKESLDKKCITVTLQSIVSAKVEKKFGYNTASIDKAVLKNHEELSMNTQFARLTMQMQSEMSEITGIYT
ncbi:hypothetical protein BEWA_009410 [Theileria equi strain WA]|uniref:Uncharacterized protein n=1 Tax=Theileria equi strain WA TaxID=1537102 RepID=L0B0Y8_THEEQ|nr:hypothetical protein BEWA_009410 [Theileria equi strain WA]AFZ81527.1 hypothetical protein BEWA_009410 [Theileria equi strain WA]|eukprot:XP_004831193.1 hypothetical protein BEWA_009410 [Theileria equi strain WA]